MDINDTNREAAFSLVTNMKHLQGALTKVCLQAENTGADVLGSVEFWARYIREDLLKLEDCPTAPRAQAQALLQQVDDVFSKQYPE